MLLLRATAVADDSLDHPVRPLSHPDSLDHHDPSPRRLTPASTGAAAAAAAPRRRGANLLLLRIRRLVVVGLAAQLARLVSVLASRQCICVGVVVGPALAAFRRRAQRTLPSLLGLLLAKVMHITQLT